MNKKQIIKVVIFLLILAVLGFGAGKLLIAKWEGPCFESVVQHEFYEQDENSIDVLFLGSSQVSEGIAVPYLYEEYGISGYSIGTSSQPIQVAYMWMKEARKTQDPKVVVLDVSRVYQTSPTVWYHRGLDNMKFSLDKAKDLWEYCSNQEEADSFMSFLLPLYMYHSRWNELTKTDFAIYEQENRIFRGFFPRNTGSSVDLDEIAFDNDKPSSKTEPIDYQFKYLEKMVEYCKENDQELLLIKTPKYDWTITKHEQMQEFADANGLTFVDFSSRALIDEVGLKGATDFGDGEHLNIIGAKKLTSWLGAYLKEHYELTDYRGTAVGEKLAEEYERCERYAVFGEAELLDDVEQYFACLNNDRYEILIQLTAPDEGLYTEEMTQLMQSLGLSVDMQNLNGDRYLAWIQNGKVKYEGTADSAFEFADKFADGTGFRIYGDFDTSVATKMRINFEDNFFTKRGINILVYDSNVNTIMNKAAIASTGSKNVLKLYK